MTVDVADSSFISTLLFAVLMYISFVVASENGAFHGAVFTVKSKFVGKERILSALKAHDSNRHLLKVEVEPQFANSIDIPIGGNGRPDSVGLYYAKIGIGTPSKEYYVQIDTGSDITWINCIQCQGCLKQGYHGLDLTQYDPNASFTGRPVTCDQEICKVINGGIVTDCKANAPCWYTENYGDKSSSMGHLVKDVVRYDGVSGDLETKLENGTVTFGCGTKQSGNLDSSDEALDGILGFGKSNASFISQLASSGKVKKMFAHCLDGDNGGGIFAIGHVVKPKVKSAHLIQDEVHYTVNVTGIEVGAEFLNLSTNSYGRVENIRAIIDSGTTLAYLPEVIYKPVLNKIVARQSDITLRVLNDQYTCINYSERVYEDFPAVTFHFENSLLLKVYPHDYMFILDGLMCLGLQNNDMDSSSRDAIILGDLVLWNKLVLYDLEKQTIGWTEYNCSSSIALKDEITGLVHLVGAHVLSSACIPIIHRSITFLLLVSQLVIHAK